jgi:hypothetical protein
MSETARTVETADGAWNYERRRPEQTLLYRLVAEHYPRFLELLADQGRSLPDYVQREFEDFSSAGFLQTERARLQLGQAPPTSHLKAPFTRNVSRLFLQSVPRRNGAGRTNRIAPPARGGSPNARH